MASRLLLFAWAARLVASAPWEKLGPRNIGDDAHGQGYAGTVADAVSPISNPNLIYAGGRNNGAASGVLKSTDRGKTWVPFCNGLFDTVISSLHIVDDAGDHVFAGTPTGIYETLDGALSWRLAPGTAGIGWARSMKNGTIDGEPHIIAGVDTGLANVPVKGGRNWTVIKAPAGTDISKFITVADVLPSSVVGVCLGGGQHGTVFIATITGPTSAEWKNTSLDCMQAAINPNNKDHFIYSNMSSNGKETWESLDGGETHHNLNNHFPYHVAIDRRGWFYTGAEAGGHRSMDGGKTWQNYQMTTTQRGTNTSGSRIPQDYQRIPTDFAGGVAFVSDQGLFIVPEGDSLELIGACGNMSNNIAICLAVSQGDGKNRWMVTTAWDWGPLASWDSGAHWPGWHCADCGGQSGIGEGGYTMAYGRSNHVLMIHHSTMLHSSQGGKNFSRVRAPTSSFAPPISTTVPNSRTEPDGRLFTVMSVPAPSNTEAAKLASAVCGGNDGDDDRDDDDQDDDQDDDHDDDHDNAAPQFIVKNSNFGAGPFDNKTGWVWGAAFPAHLSPCSLTTNPTDGSTLYAVTSSCIATSKDEGSTWSACWEGVPGPIGGLVIKDSNTMFLLRNSQVPLRTRDAGKSWSPLHSFQPIASAGFSLDLSWTGKTIIVHGVDKTKIGSAKAVFVWRSTDDGDTFVDETDDMITNHPAGGHWFDGTYYLSSSGQGIMAKVFEVLEVEQPVETLLV